MMSKSSRSVSEGFPSHVAGNCLGLPMNGRSRIPDILIRWMTLLLKESEISTLLAGSLGYAKFPAMRRPRQDEIGPTVGRPSPAIRCVSENRRP